MPDEEEGPGGGGPAPPPSPAAELSQRSVTFRNRHMASNWQEAQEISRSLFGSSATSRGRNSVFVAPNAEVLFEAIRQKALQDINQEQQVNFRITGEQDIQISSGIGGSTLYTFYSNGRWDDSISEVTVTVSFNQPPGGTIVIDSIDHLSAAPSSSRQNLRGQEGASHTRAFRKSVRQGAPPDDGKVVKGETQKSHDCSFDPSCCCVWLYELPNFEGRSVALSPESGIANLEKYVDEYFDVGSFKFVGRENLCKLEIYNWYDFKLFIPFQGIWDPDVSLPSQYQDNIYATGAYWEFRKTTTRPWDSEPPYARSVKVLYNLVPPQRNVGYWRRLASLRDEISYSNTTSITNSNAESLEHSHTEEIVKSVESGLFLDFDGIGVSGSVSSSTSTAKTVAEAIEMMYAKETSATISHQCSKKISPPPDRLPLQGALWQYRVKTKTCSDVGTDILECTWMLGGLAEPKCEPFECYNNECTLCGKDGHPPGPSTR